ncbi:Peroxidase-related enzyme [Rhodovastum atsumiense]|uniref:Peroxidase-related enzyme n=1 Tax=Rhodovastum atsumiense TaxID=504468 RepID=A0A5M6IYM2_9PROT|nr:peroxidase-related enzyme [Rhodovastum atsumiense]KAA5613446.1 peroxidase-related enzyme [Rhodovastum atsumiense]CAH2603181.1 Peroxidase-related enzyme [Rhodovastum atsumiense]
MSRDLAPPATPVSWLDLPVTVDHPTVREVFAATSAKIGYVRHQQHVLSAKPTVLAALTALGDAVVRDPDGVLSPREREVIALVVSAENRCDACVFAHAAALRGQGAAAEWVDTVAVNYRRASLTTRERALADYAVKITRAAAEIVPADLDALRQAGVPEAGILEAATVTAYFNLTNRLNSGLGIRANSEAHASHR